MDEYTPNSHKHKENQKNEPFERKIDKVIAGSAKARKKNEMQKLTSIFITEDISNVKSYILLEVLVPAIKKAIWDIVTGGIDMLLNSGERTNKNSLSSKISYSGFYKKDSDRRDSISYRSRSGYSYDDVILDNRGDAEDVLVCMEELISTYGVVRVADLYELVGITGTYTDNNYGWTDIRNASVVRTRDGYLLKLPKVVPLNRV